MSDNSINEMAINYAWNWFEHHAKQRFMAFNYFLILIGVVVVGYLKCVELAVNSPACIDQVQNAKIWWSLASAIGIFGMIISIAFWFLDIRNEELINCGRNALDSIEESMGLTIRKDDKARTYLNDSRDLTSRIIPLFCIKYLASHHFWLRSILLLSAVAFFIASIFASTSSLHLGFFINETINNSSNISNISV